MRQREGYILKHIYMGQSSGISLVLCRVEYNNKLKKERMS